MFHKFTVYGIPEDFFDQKIVENSFWKSKWYVAQESEKYSNLIVDRPIMRISESGDFATSPVLIADSINKFIEKSIYNFRNKSIFKKAISEPFEHKCIDFFRDLNFQAGQVTQKGAWKTQYGNENLNVSNLVCPGEIDLLAYNQENKILLLIECKVLNDIEDTRSYKSLVSNLKNDSQGFRSNILEKLKWVNSVFSFHNNKVKAIPLILTDIPLTVLDLNKDDVIYTDFKSLKNIINDIFLC